MDPSEPHGPSEEGDPLPTTPRAWRTFAADTASELESRLRRYAHLSADDRRRLGRRLGAVIDRALEVPPDLPARIALSTDKIRGSAPGADPVALAWSRTRLRARRTGAIGAVTTVPATVPGLGTPLAALGLVADWRYVAEQQRDLVLEIASLLGVPLHDPTRQIRSLFLASAASAFGASAAGEALSRVIARQLARRSVARIVPGAGAILAGALNYVATVALGRAAIAHFAAQAGLSVEGIVPQRVHPAMPWLRNAVVSAFQPPGGQPRPLPIFSPDDLVSIRELSHADREELLDLALHGLEAAGQTADAEEALLIELNEALGFEAAEVDAVRRDVSRASGSATVRLRRILGRTGKAGGRSSRKIWQRALRLARGMPFRRRHPPTPDP